MRPRRKALRLSVGGVLAASLALTMILAFEYSQPSSLGRIFLP